MKKHIRHHWFRVLALSVAMCCYPIEALPVQAAETDMPVTYMTYEQNGCHLSPRLIQADGREVEMTVTEKKNIPGVYRASQIPSAYSLLDDAGNSYVTSVKDQGSTGLCWAYSALGACESNIMKKGLEIPDNWRDEKGELNFSEAALGWYVYTDHYQEGDFTSGDAIHMKDKGVTGGNASIAGFSLAAGIGAQLEKYAPFSDWDNGYSEYQRFVSYYRMQNSDMIWQISEDATSVIKEWMMESGAVSASYYSAGSYYDNGSSSAYYQNRYDADYADHAILLVGWDDNYSRDNFNPNQKPENDGAWLVRNSWGDDDAYEGYFWLSYEDPSICEYTRFDMAVANSSQLCYQYDGAAVYAGIGAKAAANIFTVERDGELTQVMFPNLSSNSDQLAYTISVYRLNKSAKNPEDGKLLMTTRGMLYYSGYKGVSVPAVPLKKNEKFSVVLELSATGSSSSRNVMLGMESNAGADTGIERVCSYQDGESYVTSDGKTWIDVNSLVKMPGVNYTYPYADLGNVALKAIINSEEEPTNWTQMNEALALGAPDENSNQLFVDAYAEAISLPEDAPQQIVNNTAKNLLAGLERDGRISYPQSLYANYGSLRGDLNDNGRPDVNDAFNVLVACSARALGLIGKLRPAEVRAADVDLDSKITMNDAYRILLYNNMLSIGNDPDWDSVLNYVGDFS